MDSSHHGEGDGSQVVVGTSHPPSGVPSDERKHAAFSSRIQAARVVSRWLRTGQFPARFLEPDILHRAFVLELVCGVIKQKRLLEWVTRRVANREPDAAVKPFLLVGLYQILFLDHVADYAAVYETVEAVKRSRVASAAGFVNAVLRRTLREIYDICDAIQTQPLGIRESHPDFLLERWYTRFGEEGTEALCRWNNSRPVLTLHPHPRFTDVATYRMQLQTAGMRAEPHPFAPETFLCLLDNARVPDLPGYADGWFTVQDPATLEAVRLLDPQPGDYVLDACAAPGGKTVLIAERLRERGRITALDCNPKRLRALEENARRLRLKGIEIRVGDCSCATAMKEIFSQGAFDRILLDVPCTNTGVLRRRADARWRFTAERLAELTRLQANMLDATALLLKSGGRLVYSTCSLESEEGEKLIMDWLRRHPEFDLENSITLFPPKSGTDGMYAAAVQRR